MIFIYFLQAFIIIYVSFLSGKLLCDHFKLISESTPIKKIVYPIGIGYGILGNIAFLLGLIKLYMPAAFIIVAIGIMALSRKIIFDHTKQLKKISNQGALSLFEITKKFYSYHGFIKVIITVWIIIYIAISFSPSAMSSSDGLYYHIPFAMEFVQNTGVSFPLRNEASYGHLPIFTEIFYGIPIALFHNFNSFKIIQFAAFLLLILLIGDFVTKYVRNKIFVLFLTVLLLADMPLVRSALEGGMIDIFTTFFGFAAILAVIEANIDKQKTTEARKTFILASIFLGLALSTKYIALFFAVAYLMFLLFFLIRNNTRPKKIISDLIFYFLIIALFSGFWYLKNIIYTGNPFFPMFSTNVSGFTDEVNAFVLDKTPLNFFIFPFFFFGKEGLFLPYALITAATFISMYASVIFLFVKRKLEAIEICMFVFVQTYLLILFLTSHQIRFAIPALVGVSVLLILALDKITTYVQETYSPVAKWRTYRDVTLGVFAFILLVASMWSTTLKKDMLCLVGLKTPDACFSETTGASIYLTNYINNSLQNEMVLEYWNIFYFFHMKNGNHYSRFWCEGENDNEVEIASCLKTRGISYLVDDAKSMKSYETHPEIDHMKEKTLLVEYFRKHGTVVYEFTNPKTQSPLRLYKLP